MTLRILFKKPKTKWLSQGGMNGQPKAKSSLKMCNFDIDLTLNSCSKVLTLRFQQESKSELSVAPEQASQPFQWLCPGS